MARSASSSQVLTLTTSSLHVFKEIVNVKHFWLAPELIVTPFGRLVLLIKDIILRFFRLSGLGLLKVTDQAVLFLQGIVFRLVLLNFIIKTEILEHT